MKKRDLMALAMIGISSGLMVTGCQKGTDKKSNISAEEQKAPVDAASFYNMLSDDAKKKFDQLDEKHKAAALEMYNQSCNGKNSCAGKGGCSTAKHDCAGKNDCSGQGGAPVKDANKAVDAQMKNQQKGRNGASSAMKQAPNSAK
jgi:hypothetical protein